MKTKPNKPSSNQSLQLYSKYSGIAVQMLVVILLGVFGGVKIDSWIGWQIPVFTVILSFLAVILAIYFVTKDLLKKNKPDITERKKHENHP